MQKAYIAELEALQKRVGAWWDLQAEELTGRLPSDTMSRVAERVGTVKVGLEEDGKWCVEKVVQAVSGSGNVLKLYVVKI
jgi:hypothetical protein